MGVDTRPQTRKPHLLALLLLLTISVILQSTSVSASPSLTVATDKGVYNTSDTVYITGTLTDGGSPISGADVGINVQNNLGTTVFTDTPKTNGAGAYATNFVITGSFLKGLYTVYAAYLSAHASWQFTLSPSQISCVPSSGTVGATTTCTATVTGSSPTGTVSWTQGTPGTGTVTFFSSSCMLTSGSCSVTATRSSVGSGSVTITGTYSGDSNNAGSAGTFLLTITRGSTSTSVNCSPSSVTVGSSSTCTATVTGSSPTGTVSWTQGTPGTGTVTFSSSSCMLTSGSCSVTATRSSVGSGSVTITGTYSGDSNNAGSAGTFLLRSWVAITLRSGWNLISLPIVPNSTSIASLLRAQIASKEVVSVWTYSASSKSWRVFIPGKPSTLTTMIDGNGYWIYMKTSDTLYVDGYVIQPGSTPPTYQLNASWNLVGFKSEPLVTGETVGQYLLSISGKYDSHSVWVYDNANPSWVRAGSSYMLEPGQAMWILVTSPTGATLRP